MFPLGETIDVWACVLYHRELKLPPFQRALFIELMQMVTSLVEFMCNNVMYRQFDDETIGFPSLSSTC